MFDIYFNNLLSLKWILTALKLTLSIKFTLPKGKICFEKILKSFDVGSWTAKASFTFEFGKKCHAVHHSHSSQRDGYLRQLYELYIFTAPHTWWLDPLLNYSTNNLTYFQTQTQTEPFSHTFRLKLCKKWSHTKQSINIFLRAFLPTGKRSPKILCSQHPILL